MATGRMTRAEAERVVSEATDVLLAGWARLGLGVGAINMDGEVITPERWAKIHQILDDAAWEALRESGIVVEGG